MAARTSSITARTFAILALPATVLLLWLCVWITDQKTWQHNAIPYLTLYPTRLLLIGISALLLVAAFAIGVLRARWTRRWKRGFAAALAAALTVLVLEAAFMFVPHSHNVGHTLAAVVWHRAYWRPINSLGYRDAEHVRLPGKRVVFAIGDSFTAGDGLTSVSQRYTDLLAARRPELQVLNLGVNGADTHDELRQLQAHPLRPDVLLLQYFPNDIEGAIRQAGASVPRFTPYEDIEGEQMRELVRGSFLANFVYWQFPHGDLVAYARCIEQGFRNQAVIEQHVQDLDRFCTYAAQHHIPLVVALFPLLTDLENCRGMVAPVKELFEARGARIVDVADLVQDMDVGERTIHGQDAHASPVVHERVAEALARVLLP